MTREHSIAPPVRHVHRSGAVRGRPDAFAATYREHHQALYRYCRAILGQDDDAHDALQSTMTRAYAALQTEERDFELRPWLFRIAHNESISLLRARRPTVELEAAAAIGEDTLERRVDDRADLILLRQDMADLPDRQRAALVMRELSGLAHQEIGEALGVSTAAAKQTIFEARTALHQCREGRAMECESIRRALSDADGRVLRGRRVRAHLRSCRGCSDFAGALRSRPQNLAALAPPLPAAAGAALLLHVAPGAKATAAGASALGFGSGAVATKAVVTVGVLVCAAGGGVAIRAETADRDSHPATRVVAPSTTRAPAAGASAAPGPTAASASKPRSQARGAGRHAAARQRHHAISPLPAAAVDGGSLPASAASPAGEQTLRHGLSAGNAHAPSTRAPRAFRSHGAPAHSPATKRHTKSTKPQPAHVTAPKHAPRKPPPAPANGPADPAKRTDKPATTKTPNPAADHSPAAPGSP